MRPNIPTLKSVTAACAALAFAALLSSSAWADTVRVTISKTAFSLDFGCNTRAEQKALSGGATATIYSCERAGEKYTIMITDYHGVTAVLSTENLLEQYVKGFSSGNDVLTENTTTTYSGYLARRTVTRFDTRPVRELSAMHLVVNGMTVSVMAFTEAAVSKTPEVMSFLGSLKIDTVQ